MGTKTPQNEHRRNDGDLPNSNESYGVGGEPRGSHMSRDGDGCLGDVGGGDDDDGDGDSDAEAEATTLGSLEAAFLTTNGADAQKKRKKPKKKSKKKKKKVPALAPVEQSSPPTVLLSDLFSSGQYPEGEIQSYTEARTAAAEARQEARSHWQDDSFLQNYRKAAEAHRQTRQWVQECVKPGHTLLEVAEGIENSVRALLGHTGLEPGDSLKAGMGFPTGLCLNNQVAHYTPSPGQKDVVLQQDDILTVDFGVHINGWIVDSAFTMAFDHTHDDLLAAVKDATNTGIKTAGVDVRISDVSAAIQEAMESHEVEIRGKTFPVKPVRNLSAHDIKQYRIHGGKSIPFVKNSDQTKMEEGEVFAIETFGTTGRGYVVDDVGVYGYGLNHDAPLSTPLSLASARRLHRTIRENFGTIPFCRRYLERLGVERYLAGMNSLVSNGIVECYLPLMDTPGSYSAQFEHTILLRETHKEVLSRGDDY
ncbi:methionine aminopeptidase 2-1 [Fonsecaea pedrosoi CBS 271.37]|uniref:Methionine aminopeptidase 2 n=1 Tax=Fonsecaea pedrosoi CBS 271.37 TaxID=1442368 RepID=A0A0D2GQE0_9EURO|nr:methionine aminopeptidase 2-1 [Fonsecaea pedrosoi CBS 271.37]KIW74624.1 methionine aminopeptidase 2-1 [Fonsecaea pedrosoi CBS 271.37]